jgi:hypothetical protein
MHTRGDRPSQPRRASTLPFIDVRIETTAMSVAQKIARLRDVVRPTTKPTIAQKAAQLGDVVRFDDEAHEPRTAHRTSSSSTGGRRPGRHRPKGAPKSSPASNGWCPPSV